ncbi:DUF3678 domain-containing protein [Methylobacterium sp. WL30]|nr:DUF3678 domain-containing protein [Methylobacterium sp. WL93]TXN51462.1 DUF3678 domain-containing protein [Methylobacterium sp. WL119]TXN63803.1 DUF3678 domain-containing protein [Methylobacterium sp. WL30]
MIASVSANRATWLSYGARLLAWSSETYPASSSSSVASLQYRRAFRRASQAAA